MEADELEAKVTLASFDVRTVYICEVTCLKECMRLVPAFSRHYNIKIFEARYQHRGVLGFSIFTAV